MNWMVHKSNISPVYHSNKLALLSSKKIAGTKRVYHKKTVMGIIFKEVRGTSKFLVLGHFGQTTDCIPPIGRYKLKRLNDESLAWGWIG
jgi:hypothetical protein